MKNTEILDNVLQKMQEMMEIFLCNLCIISRVCDFTSISQTKQVPMSSYTQMNSASYGKHREY